MTVDIKEIVMPMPNEHEHNDSIPTFKASLPDHLLANLSEQDRWLHERVDIAAQQTDYILRQQRLRKKEFEDHTRSDIQEFGSIKHGVAKINEQLLEWDRLKVMLTSKWSVCAFVFGTIIIPLGVMLVGFIIRERVVDQPKPVPTVSAFK